MTKDYDFSGRTAVVTGAATGLGFAIASRLANCGASVALVDIDEQGLADKSEQLATAPGKVQPFVCDVSSAQDVERAVAAVGASFGPVNTLVNNAGIVTLKPYVDQTDDEFDRQVAVNLKGTHHFMSRLLPGMMERREGYVVNIASVAALHYTAPHAQYAASKAAVMALSRDVAFEAAPYGVRVNCVAPGLIAVPQSPTKKSNWPFEDAVPGEAPVAQHARTTTRPLGFGRPEDIANAVAFLLSDDARFIVGVTLPVAGGTNLLVSIAMPGDELPD
jgi:NAD(P)-dependent dehydrogenase (short-subunit alcohol dehydrogenase family)